MTKCAIAVALLLAATAAGAQGKVGATLARLETNPPAALYNAPAQRQKAIVKNPDTLKKLLI